MSTQFENWQDSDAAVDRRYRQDRSQDYRPVVGGELSQREWETIWDAHEGKISHANLSKRCWNYAGQPLRRIIGDAIYHDTGRKPAENDPWLYQQFGEMLSARADLTGGGVASAAFLSMQNAWVIDGLLEASNSLEDIELTDELSDFKSAPIIQCIDQNFLQPLAKGGSAAGASTTIISLGEWRLTRFALRASIDERVMIDAVPGSIRKSLEALGRAAKRAWLDLAWSTILSNPVLEQDGKAVFHADHGNLGTGEITDFGSQLHTVDSSPLATALGAIRRQSFSVGDGIGSQINHLNLEPRFLIVSPELELVARTILHKLRLEDNIELRVESRLTDLGVRNPLSGKTLVGNRANWVLTCDKTAPWLVRGILSGGRLPRVRTAYVGPDTDPGFYGLGVDVSWDLAIKVTDYRPCYFGTSAS